MFNSEIIQTITNIILVSVIVFSISSILPGGSISGVVKFVLGILLSLTIFMPILELVNMQYPTDYIVYQSMETSVMKGLELQINQMNGFKKAKVSADIKNNKVVSLYIIASKDENNDALTFNKNKIALKNFLKVLYKLDENKIIIEVS